VHKEEKMLLNWRAGFLAICIAALASTGLAACAFEEDMEAEEESLSEEEAVADPVPNCDPGWHGHVTTWPRTGMYHVGWCGDAQKQFSVPAGTGVCMQDGPATPCGGQGYARVWYSGTYDYYWARMEAFNGH
jgi:hypothetical protein